MNQDASDTFNRIVDELVMQHADVAAGKMMSSPGIKVNDKVFAFLAKGDMGFRLGPDFDLDAAGVKAPRPLSPFKTKPPLKGWFLVPADESDIWWDLSEHALAFTRSL